MGGSIVLLPTLFAACSDDDDNGGVGPTPNAGVTLNLNTDVGILNYAYALEQLEAAFYTAVVGATNFNTLFTSAAERELLTDIRNHEVIHREFLRQVLGTAAIGSLALNMTTVNTALASRASILATAEAFEDLGVAAYNGAGKQLKDANNLLVAGKIVSVEARHAAAIRDVRDLTASGTATSNTRFAGDDVVGPTGLDVKGEPSEVLARVKATNFVTTQITIGTQGTVTGTGSNLPPA
jgi:hypothetical protein